MDGLEDPFLPHRQKVLVDLSGPQLWVVTDDRIPPGQQLGLLLDEAHGWVEAQDSPDRGRWMVVLAAIAFGLCVGALTSRFTASQLSSKRWADPPASPPADRDLPPMVEPEVAAAQVAAPGAGATRSSRRSPRHRPREDERRLRWSEVLWPGLLFLLLGTTFLLIHASIVKDMATIERGGGTRGWLQVTDERCARSCSLVGEFISDDGTVRIEGAQAGGTRLAR